MYFNYYVPAKNQHDESFSLGMTNLKNKILHQRVKILNNFFTTLVVLNLRILVYGHKCKPIVENILLEVCLCVYGGVDIENYRTNSHT